MDDADDEVFHAESKERRDDRSHSYYVEGWESRASDAANSTQMGSDLKNIAPTPICFERTHDQNSPERGWMVVRQALPLWTTSKQIGDKTWWTISSRFRVGKVSKHDGYRNMSYLTRRSCLCTAVVVELEAEFIFHEIWTMLF